MSNIDYYVRVKDECSNIAYGVRHDKEYAVITSSSNVTDGIIYNIVNESGELIGINEDYVNVRAQIR